MKDVVSSRKSIFFRFACGEKMEGQQAEQAEKENFSSLMAMGTEYVSAYLAGHPTKIQPCILQQLEAMPIDHSLRLALWSLCGGSPVPVIKEIQSKTEGKSNVCALVWKPGNFCALQFPTILFIPMYIKGILPTIAEIANVMILGKYYKHFQHVFYDIYRYF